MCSTPAARPEPDSGSKITQTKTPEEVTEKPHPDERVSGPDEKMEEDPPEPNEDSQKKPVEDGT
jgi:hypothetical protein